MKTCPQFDKLIIQKMGLFNYQNYPENGASQLPRLSRKWAFDVLKTIPVYYHFITILPFYPS